MKKTLAAGLVAWLCAGAPVQAATVLSGLTFAVNNSEAGNYFWSPGSYANCSGSLAAGGCGEVGGGSVNGPGGLLYENKRTMSEFFVYGQDFASQAILSFEVYDPWGYYIQGQGAAGNVIAYQGNGSAQLADWGATAAATVGTFSVNAACPLINTGPCATISIDITNAYNLAIQNGWLALGIRLQAPTVSPGTASMFHHFRIEATAVPVPGAVGLYSAALAILGAMRFRRSARAD
jgi:hypothetical protein